MRRWSLAASAALGQRHWAMLDQVGHWAICDGCSWSGSRSTSTQCCATSSKIWCARRPATVVLGGDHIVHMALRALRCSSPTAVCARLSCQRFEQYTTKTRQHTTNNTPRKAHELNAFKPSGCRERSTVWCAPSRRLVFAQVTFPRTLDADSYLHGHGRSKRASATEELQSAVRDAVLRAAARPQTVRGGPSACARWA